MLNFIKRLLGLETGTKNHWHEQPTTQVAAVTPEAAPVEPVSAAPAETPAAAPAAATKKAPKAAKPKAPKAAKPKAPKAAKQENKPSEIGN